MAVFEVSVSKRAANLESTVVAEQFIAGRNKNVITVESDAAQTEVAMSFGSLLVKMSRSYDSAFNGLKKNNPPAAGPASSNDDCPAAGTHLLACCHHVL